ncbi:metallophosphoesterase [Haloarchaeobius salinus]|uniref:metallophosphoesterase n=1 Tax=Haloarchaeobius salinus TaxID=1198298 RepID=UPI00210923C7|nr:metallophosphoesterase [Haloarchaeobius salinus]
MGQRYLVLGDHHGDTESLRRVRDDIEGETFDFVVHVGDVTDAMRAGRETAVRQLREVEPLLDAIASHARHGLIWVWGNRDHFGDLDADLDVGTEAPSEGCVTVGGQRFTNDLDAVASDVVLVTHMETWRLLDHFEGRAHFCGNTHLGRLKGRRVNSAFLQYTHRETGEQSFGGYFVVDVTDEPPFDVEVHEVGTLNRFDCPAHGERGVQYHAAFDGCMYCAESDILMREMAASAFYGLTDGTDREAVREEALVSYAVELWEDPPRGFRSAFADYIEGIDGDRYAPLDRADDGLLAVAERSYAY